MIHFCLRLFLNTFREYRKTRYWLNSRYQSIELPWNVHADAFISVCRPIYLALYSSFSLPPASNPALWNSLLVSIWQAKCTGRNTWFTGPAIAVTRWYVVHLMIAGTWSTVANLIDDFCRALTLADGKLSSKNPPWWQVPNFVFLFMDFFALSSPTHYVLREFENKYSLMKYDVKSLRLYIRKRRENNQWEGVGDHETERSVAPQDGSPSSVDSLSFSWNRKQGCCALRQSLVPMGLFGFKSGARWEGTAHIIRGHCIRPLSQGLRQNCFFLKSYRIQKKTPKIETKRLCVI